MPDHNRSGLDRYGLNVREIYHRHYGICQLVYVAVSGCWVGLNEKNRTLTAPDNQGYPNLERLSYARYLYEEWTAYLQILEPSFEPEGVMISHRAHQEEMA